MGLAFGSVTAFKDVTVSVEALLDALVQQPVSVAIEADRVLYSGGVMTGCATCGSSDHWKVEESWGQSGCFRLERSKGGAEECGILSYPLVSSSAVGVVVSSFWRYTVRFAKQRVKSCFRFRVPSVSPISFHRVGTKKRLTIRTTISDVRCWILFFRCLMVGIHLPMHGLACVINKGRFSVTLGFLLKQQQGFRWEHTGRFCAIKEATDLSKKFDSLEAKLSSSD